MDTTSPLERLEKSFIRWIEKYNYERWLELSQAENLVLAHDCFQKFIEELKEVTKAGDYPWNEIKE
jgi:hypothetical protein